MYSVEQVLICKNFTKYVMKKKCNQKFCKNYLESTVACKGKIYSKLERSGSGTVLDKNKIGKYV
jgi:hypothetical protein